MARFEGIITPMITPFNRDEEQSINYEAGEMMVEKLIAGGVKGIFPFGTNGEFHVCSFEEKIDFSKFVIEKVAGRVPVFVGTGACSTKEAIALSKAAEEIGADALSVICPYCVKPTLVDLEGYFREIAESVKIPIILYNIPGNTGTNYPAELVAKLMEIPNIVGVKDSSGTMDNLKSYVEVAEGKEFDVLVGSDSKIYPALKLGAVGAIAGTSNLITENIVGLYNAVMAGDDARAQELQADIEPLRDVIHLGAQPSMIKRALELSGIPVGPARKPTVESTPEKDEQVRAMLDHYGIAHE
ncbi:MAG: 4-hydroxy-tetrahydrodipicolinate synthase [Atopobiaceae bacterium]|nr:4-hydroxy-tetrahydrodipicolinate synthase [Atopobiaceae bacterium]